MIALSAKQNIAGKLSLADEMRFKFVQQLSTNQAVLEEDYRSVYGDGGSQQFWEDFVYSNKKLDSFIQTLALAGAENWETIELRCGALRMAIMEAYRSDETWFRGETQQFTSATYFRDLATPSTIEVRPRDAVAWLLGHPTRKALIPSSLAFFLSEDGINAVVRTNHSGVGGRPTSKHLWQQKLESRGKVNEIELTLVDEARWLAEWLERQHPNAHRATAKTIENDIRSRYRELRKALKPAPKTK